MEKYLTTEEVAKIARTSPSTVRYWRHLGKGPRGVKRGRRVLYAESAVTAWMTADDEQRQAVA
ncbi:helix-turn-helix domain-containing protein [Micromonospora chalcea]|uniref:helix-turn-helix domain-containing protein n=1 Tax=Micromonospora chalcea TaxID=1874 RepID=UPI0033CCB9AE